MSKLVTRANARVKEVPRIEVLSSDYTELLEGISRTRPQLATVLVRAENSRIAMLRQYHSGARLRGLEQLLDYLSIAKEVFDRHPRLAKVSFLLSRARDDFEVAIEATMSGARGVVADQMRDVMEIQFLLRDFENDSTRIEDWLRANDQERYKRFQPYVLRQRARLKIKPEDLAETTDYEAADYKAHRAALQVRPRQTVLGGKGFARDEDQIGKDMCFWEIFDHGRRLIRPIHQLKRRVAPNLKGTPSPHRGLKAFRDGWELTQDMQAIFLSLLEGSEEESGEDGDTGAAEASSAPFPEASRSTE
jgi:hypothetical protein